MTKAEMVQDLLKKMEDRCVGFPKWVRIWSDPTYWEKYPAGYVFDEVQGEDSKTHFTLESQLSGFSKIALTRLLDFPIPMGIWFSQLWQLWGRNGLLAMPAAMITLDGNTHLQLRSNLFISYQSNGYIASNDLSGKHIACMPCDTMQKSFPYLALLTKKNQICMGIYWSYLAQAMAPWEEFPYLLRYNPALLGNFLITVEREHPEGFPRPVKGKIPAYAVPQLVGCLSVENCKLEYMVCLSDHEHDDVFAQLYLGTDRVSLCVHQVDGDHIHSFDFPEWDKESKDEEAGWNWNKFYECWDSETGLTKLVYNRFMWYRLSVLLLALAGVSFTPDQFYTQQSKKFKFAPIESSSLIVRDMQELEMIIEEF